MNSNEVNQQPDHKDPRCRRRWMIPFFMVGAIVIKGGLFLLLWNALIPDLFNGPVLHFGQAIGLLILAKLLVGFHGPMGFMRGFGRFGGGPFGGRGRGPWKHMSHEEREKLREALRARGS